MNKYLCHNGMEFVRNCLQIWGGWSEDIQISV